MREDGKEEEGFSPRALVYKWRLTGVACVVSEFRVTQPPLLSCFLELSLTLGIQPIQRKQGQSSVRRAETPVSGHQLRQRSATHTVTHTGHWNPDRLPLFS